MIGWIIFGILFAGTAAAIVVHCLITEKVIIDILRNSGDSSIRNSLKAVVEKKIQSGNTTTIKINVIDKSYRCVASREVESDYGSNLSVGNTIYNW